MKSKPPPELQFQIWPLKFLARGNAAIAAAIFLVIIVGYFISR